MKPATGTCIARAAEELPVAEGPEEPPDFDPVELPDLETEEPVAAVEAPELVAAARKRSLDWNVLQLDEEGVTGVYGGEVVNGSGILQVRVCPLDE